MTESLRVLYVDDEPGLLELGKMFLEREGVFTVDTLTSAEEALTLLNTERYDAIISDYQMAEIDGIAFLKQLKKSGNTTPFIIFTGKGREEVVIEALNEGADFYLQKGGEPKAQFAELSNKIRYAVKRRDTEEELSELQKRTSDIIEFLPDATFVIDREGTVIAWNLAMEKMTGIHKDDMIGKGDHACMIPFYGERRQALLDLLDFDDAKIRARYEYVKRDGTTLSAEVFTPALYDGKGAYVWVTGSPLFDIRGNRIGAIESIRDITDWKKTEVELRESEARYRNVVEDQTEFICRFLPDGTHVFVNEVYCRYFGLNKEEIIGTRFHPDIHPDDRENVNRCFASVNINHPLITMDQRIIMPDGNTRWQRWSDRAIFYADGSLKEYQSVGRDITETKQIEEALHYNQEKYTKAFLSSPDAIMISDLETGIFIELNDAASQIYGYSRDEMIGRSALELGMWLRKEDRDILIDQVRRNGRVERYELIERCKSGKLFTASVSAQTITLADRLHFISVVRDVTERKRAEEALRNSEARLLTLVKSIPDLIWLKDKEGVYLSCNARFERFIGAREIDIIGKTDYDFVDRTLADSFREHDREAMAARRPIINEEWITFADGGHRVLLETIKTPIFDDKGTLIGVLGIGHDITERKQNEEALRASEQFTKEIIHNAQEGIIVYDQNFNYLVWNSFMESLTGISASEALGNNAIDLFPHLKEQNVHIMLQQALNGDTVQSPDTPYHVLQTKKSGWVSGIYSPHYNTQGDIVGVIGIIRDITDQKKIEISLNAASKKLNLLSSITRHDINNQLTVQMGYLSMLEKKQLDPTLTEYFQKVSNAAKRISAMIAFTKEYESIGVNAPVWQDCYTIVDTAAKQTPLGKITVKNNITSGTEVLADPLIIKVFFNLMDNAVRYGGKITEIRFFGQESGDEHIIICEDDGEGISADEKEKIFEKGFGKNTGLGLFLSREILSITGITIRETGSPGKGARFEITFPKSMWRIAQIPK